MNMFQFQYKQSPAWQPRHSTLIILLQGSAKIVKTPDTARLARARRHTDHAKAGGVSENPGLTRSAFPSLGGKPRHRRVTGEVRGTQPLIHPVEPFHAARRHR